MSQNKASSSATRPTFSPTFSLEISEAQKQAVGKYTNIIQEFCSGNISTPRVTVLLQQMIAHVDTDEESFMSTYESYFSMLDNFEQHWSANLQHINEVQQWLAGTPGIEQRAANKQSAKDVSAGSFKRQHSFMSEDEEDEYLKKTQLNFSILLWNESEYSSLELPVKNFPSLQKPQEFLLGHQKSSFFPP
jgi:hypothetical protein